MIGTTFKMELLYIVFFIYAFSNVQCDDCSNYLNNIRLEKYEVYLIGFSMLIMFMTIIGLSIALYMIRNNKTIFGININKKSIYVRQESTQGVIVRSYANNVSDLRRNDGSTFTVNSGIVEVSGITEPETPTCVEPKDEKKPPCIKKPLVQIKPNLQKAQMDNIIKQVLLSKKSERDSTTLRELEAFTTQRITREDEKESSFKDASTNSKDSDATTKENNHVESLYENLPTKLQKQSNADEVKSKQVSLLKTYQLTDGDRVDGFETHVKVEDDQEVYDMLPNPVRCVDENLEYGYIEDLAVYDCPPRTSWENAQGSNVVLDQDTNYLLILSKTKDDDKASYINARRRNSP